MVRFAALRADEDRHVLYDPENRHVHLLEHAKPLLRIDQGNVLRRRHDDRTRDRHGLRKSELNVARPRRHVDDEVIEVVPVRLIKELLQSARGQRTAPNHRFVFGNHEADRIDFQTVARQRFHHLAVGAHGLSVRTEHRRLRGTVNVGVEHAHARPFKRKRQREVRGNRRLADAALAGTHRNDVLHVRKRLRRSLHLVSDDFLTNVHFNARRTGRLQGLAHGFTNGLRGALGRVSQADRNGHVPRFVHRQAFEHLSRDVVRSRHGFLLLCQYGTCFVFGNHS